MKLIGKIIGTIFPKPTIPVEICDHRYGAVATVTQDTDTLPSTNNSRYAGELYGFKYNIGLGAFISPFNDTTVDKSECEDTGRIRMDVYYPVEKWKNPITEIIQDIPDYSSLTWTSAGVAVFSGAVLGASKVTQYPSHGQEMYDISGGAYGYDLINGVYGLSELSELYGVSDYVLEFYDGLLGRRLSSISYRVGDNSASKMLIAKFLSGRNSSYSTNGNSLTEYGKSKISPFNFLGLPQQNVDRANFLNRASSTRWWEMWHSGGFTELAASNYSTAEIQKTIADGGWFTDFIHWHDCYNAGDMAALGRYFNIINTAIGVNFVHRCSFGEASEYLFFRELISRVSAFEKGNRVHIVLQKKDLFASTFTNGIPNNLPLSSINTTLSIKIDLAGTYLSGKDVSTNSSGLISLGADEYIVEIDLVNKKEGFIEIVLEETLTPTYYNFNIPIINSANVVSEILTVTTDQKTKCVIFIVNRGADISTAILLTRSNDLKTTHSIELTTANQGKDIYIGIINNVGQSHLSNVYQFI